MLRFKLVAFLLATMTSLTAFAGSIVCRDLVSSNQATYIVNMTSGPNGLPVGIMSSVMGTEATYSLETDNYPSPVNTPSVITSFVGINKTNGARIVINFSFGSVGSVVRIEPNGVFVFDVGCEWLEG